VGHKKDRLRLAAARAQCAHCNERTGPYVADGVKGSEKKGAGYGGNREIASKENRDERYFRFACTKPGCGGALPPVLRNATFERNPKKAPANCNPEYKVADRLQRAWQDEHIVRCCSPPRLPPKRRQIHMLTAGLAPCHTDKEAVQGSLE
jgi:hypothetical protein